MFIVTLCLLVILNLVAVVALVRQSTNRAEHPQKTARPAFALMLIIGLWLGLVVAVKLPKLATLLIETWWMHIGLTITALGALIGIKGRSSRPMQAGS